MKNGWTGGQYSLVRALTGVYLLVRFTRVVLVPSDTPFAVRALVAVATVASIFFITGWFDRIAAIVMAFALACTLGQDPLVENATSPLVACMLVTHACLPRAPFGSVAALGRVDPGGDWRYPPALFLAARIATACVFVYVVTRVGFRPIVDSADSILGMLLALLFVFDPAWIRKTRPGTTDYVFFDGTCGLCHDGVRFLLAEDVTGEAFLYAPLGGECFTATIQDRTGLPDTIILRTAAGETLVRSAAVLHSLRRLGGLWRVVAFVLALIPRVVLDAAYDGIARIRYRIFGRRKVACPLMPPAWRSRFMP